MPIWKIPKLKSGLVLQNSVDISTELSEVLFDEVKEVGKLIGFMIANPEKFGSAKPKQN